MIEVSDGVKLTHCLLLVLRTGQENAIKGNSLAEMLGYYTISPDGKKTYQTRAIRLAIEELIQDGYPVCSTPHPPYGYYMAATQEEVDEALRILRYGYGRKLYQHYTALRRAGVKAFGSPEVRAGQLSLL